MDTQEGAAFQLCDCMDVWAPAGIFLRGASTKFELHKVMFKANFTESPRVFKTE
jgi:hypothetical protein